ncbi:glycosyltransferase [Candidatus Saccharibacteria bacterium]|nr:glycosyltransferase [Candidatus Saccharibacteria bacterium]
MKRVEKKKAGFSNPKRTGSQKKKVLFVIHTLQVGGAERILINLVNSLPKKKFDITVMTIVDMGKLKDQLASHIKYKSVFSFNALKRLSGGDKKYSSNINSTKRKNPVKTLVIKAYELFWRRADLEKLYREHVTEKYDIEVAFLEGIPSKFIGASNNKASKKIAWIHVDLINEPKSDRFFNNLKEQKELYSRFDKIVCVSKVVKEQFYKKYGIAKNKTCVVYNPIDSVSIIKKARKKASIKKAAFTFCSVGRLSTQKGYDRLIAASSKLKEDGFNFETWIIGVGAEENNLRKLIAEYDAMNVKLLGYKENPYPYLKMSDVFVCSSRAEGFSTAVSEAIILEKPIITTKCSGMEEMLGDSKYGLVCENNLEELYQSMWRILTDKEILNKYKTSVRKRAGLFSLKKSMAKIESMLETI